MKYQVVATGEITIETKKNTSIAEKFAANQEAIEEVWQKALLEREGKLFNGTLFNLEDYTNEGRKVILFGDFVEYKFYLAQRKNPNLKFGIRPLAVAGIINMREGNRRYVFIAKRSAHVTSYPEWWELVPSGGLNRKDQKKNRQVDYKKRISLEFEEETGLPRSYIRRTKGFALVRDVADDVFDICCELSLSVPRSVVSREFKSEEYGQSIFVPINQLGQFVTENSPIITPTSLAIIEILRKSARTKLRRDD